MPRIADSGRENVVMGWEMFKINSSKKMLVLLVYDVIANIKNNSFSHPKKLSQCWHPGRL